MNAFSYVRLAMFVLSSFLPFFTRFSLKQGRCEAKATYPNGNKKVKLICVKNAAFGTGSNTIDCKIARH